VLVRWLSRHREDFQQVSLLNATQAFIATKYQSFLSDAWLKIKALLEEPESLADDFEHHLCNHNEAYTKAKEIVFGPKIPLTEAQAITLAAIRFQIEHRIEKAEYQEEYNFFPFLFYFSP